MHSLPIKALLTRERVPSSPDPIFDHLVYVPPDGPASPRNPRSGAGQRRPHPPENIATQSSTGNVFFPVLATKKLKGKLISDVGAQNGGGPEGGREGGKRFGKGFPLSPRGGGRFKAPTDIKTTRIITHG